MNQFRGMYNASSTTLPKGIYAVLVEEIGTLNIKATVEEPVLVSIDAYSHNINLLKSAISSPPEWLSEKGSVNDQIAYLKTVVRMLIQHPFKYEAFKHSNVYYYPVDDNDTD